MPYLVAALGFAFVWVWIDVDFSAAILCLVGSLVFLLIAALLVPLVRGDVDVEQLQERLGYRRERR